MAAVIRQANRNDAEKWLDLVKETLGTDYHAPEVYELSWISDQLDPASGHETWVIELDDVIQSGISFLPAPNSPSKIANLGRNLHRPISFLNGTAETLLLEITRLASSRNQVVVARIPSSDNLQQSLYENMGFACVGFQPLKHIRHGRVGILFYVRPEAAVLEKRIPHRELLPVISEIAQVALAHLGLSNAVIPREGATGYPLQTDVTIHEASFDDFGLWKSQAQSANPAQEISGSFHLGLGLMRIQAAVEIKTLFAQRGDRVAAGLTFYHDDHDRCVRLTDSFSADDLSLGALLQQCLKISQEQFSAVYVEIDVLSSATRLLKTVEQLGFVAVSYLPGFFSTAHGSLDVVKLVKLNTVYSLDVGNFTAHAQEVVTVVDQLFQDHKVGSAIINLLRGLSIFSGLGDGELRKMARLFTQKLFRPGEKVFNKGDQGGEAFIVMRGQIDIQLEEDSKSIATITTGKIFGELAFLDGAVRNAHAIAATPSIVFVIQRLAFNELVQREPRLGMIVMRNIALDLSSKLRSASSVLSRR